MKSRVHNSLNLIFATGTQVVLRKGCAAGEGRDDYPAGTVGVIVRSPADRQHAYRVRFIDGFEAALHHDELMQLAEFKQGDINDPDVLIANRQLFDRVIYRCVVGSRAFGLDTDASDTDRRGIYLPPADLHWSIFGVPEQLENDANEEVYWELQKFISLALKGNPNILECLYSPLIEEATPLARELLDIRTIFLSQLVYQTYNGYVMSQFKKMQADLRNKGFVKPKHVMHLIRLLLSGIHLLNHGEVLIDVGPFRDRLLAIREGEMSTEQVESWRCQLHGEFDAALKVTRLPHRPDYHAANDFLIRARRLAIEDHLP